MAEVKRIEYVHGTRYEINVDAETKLIYLSGKYWPSLIVGYRIGGEWHYQSLMWSCRGGKKKYFRALVHLYRYLRRNKVTKFSLRYIAWGEDRWRNGGLAVVGGQHA